LRKQRKNI